MDTFTSLINFRRQLERAERLAKVYADFLSTLTSTALRKLTMTRKQKGLPRLTRQQIQTKLFAANERNFDKLRVLLSQTIEEIKQTPDIYLPYGEPQLSLIPSVKKVPQEAEIFFPRSEDLKAFIVSGINHEKQRAVAVMATIKIEYERDGIKKINIVTTKVYSTKTNSAEIAAKMIDTGYEGGNIISFHLHLLYPKYERIVRLADYKIENCLIKVLRYNTTDEKITKLYQKFPELVPVDGGKVYVNEKQIIAIAKFSAVKFRIHTPLGIKMGQPWCEYGGSKKKHIDVVIANEHATVIPSKRVDRVVYVDELIAPTDPSVFYQSLTEIKPKPVEVIGDNGRFILNFYISREQGRNVLYKKFKPSMLTNNPEDDQNPLYFHYYKSDQLLASLFCQENKIYPVKNDTIRQIILSVERFIGRAKISYIPEHAIAIDRNRHYASAELSPFYIGYPEDTLVIGNDLTTAAYIIGTLTNAPAEYKVFFSEQEKVFTRPEYDYLVSRGATFKIEYTLNAPLRNVSIYDWSAKQMLDTKREKEFTNSLIGRLITGGVKQEEPVLIQFANSSERDRLIHECADRELPFKMVMYDQETDCETEIDQVPYKITEEHMCPRGHCRGYIRVTIPKLKTTGRFNFHAYLMGYASIAMYMAVKRITDVNYTLHAYNVDCLIVSPNNQDCQPLMSETTRGLWKIEKIKAHYHQFTEKIHQPHIKDLPVITPPARRIHIKHTAVIAAAGLGKSYEHLIDPAVNQVYTTPTHDLKNEIMTKFPGIKVHTAHKIFQFTIRDDKTWLGMIKDQIIPHPGSVLVLDELTMYDQDQIKLVIRRANLTNTIIVALGDFCQITQNINGEAITEDFIKQYFTVETKERTEDCHSRHAYKYGLELDALRGLTHRQQLEYLKNSSAKWKRIRRRQDIIDSYTEKSIRLIVGSHYIAHEYHQEIKGTHPTKNIICRFKNKKITEEKVLPISNPLIWWDRKSMRDIMPADKKYEPAYAATVDSFQGKTAAVIIDYEDITRPGVLYTAITRSECRPWLVDSPVKNEDYRIQPPQAPVGFMPQSQAAFNDAARNRHLIIAEGKRRDRQCDQEKDKKETPGGFDDI